MHRSAELIFLADNKKPKKEKKEEDEEDKAFKDKQAAGTANMKHGGTPHTKH